MSEFKEDFRKEWIALYHSPKDPHFVIAAAANVLDINLTIVKKDSTAELVLSDRAFRNLPSIPPEGTPDSCTKLILHFANAAASGSNTGVVSANDATTLMSTIILNNF